MDRIPSSTYKAVEANVRSVADLEREFESRRGFSEKIADLIAGFSGSMSFVGLHAIWFVLWFLINTRVLPILPAFDRIRSSCSR